MSADYSFPDRGDDLVLYWIGDQRSARTKWSPVADLKWKLLWNDVVCIADDFVLTNVDLRNALLSVGRSGSFHLLLLEGSLRIVVRNRHTANRIVNTFEDAAGAILDDRDFFWAESRPADSFVENVGLWSRSHILRPKGMDVEERFRTKLTASLRLDDDSVAAQYYRTCFLREATSKCLTETDVAIAVRELELMQQTQILRRSTLYRLANDPNVISDGPSLVHAQKFPDTLRRLGNDIFIHNLIENFWPIASLPPGQKMPVWFDVHDPGALSQRIHGERVREIVSEIPVFVEDLDRTIGSLTQEDIVALRRKGSGRTYRRLVSSLYSKELDPSESVLEQLVGVAVAYLFEISKRIGASSPPDSVSYVMRGEIVERRTEFGLRIGIVRRGSEHYGRGLKGRL